jgi:integrase
MLLYTGARRGETLQAKWADIDLRKKTWSKPGATTKRKTTHHVPLSDEACRLLARIKAGSPAGRHLSSSASSPGLRASACMICGTRMRLS